MSSVISKDGTTIAFETVGQGPAVLMVNGAFGYRDFYGERELAALLSKDFTVYLYDRRGRGESTDTLPYAVEREIEDIDALIDRAGGLACIYGASSGAALALLAAAKLGRVKIPRLALYEPPYGLGDEAARQEFAKQKQYLSTLISEGKRGDATRFFVSGMGTPPEIIEEMCKSQEWKDMEGVEHTLAYDYAILNDGAVPVALAQQTSIPAIIMDGEKSMPFMQEAAETLGRAMPSASRKTLKDQTHEPSALVLAPVLQKFFRA